MILRMVVENTKYKNRYHERNRSGQIKSLFSSCFLKLLLKTMFKNIIFVLFEFSVFLFLVLFVIKKKRNEICFICFPYFPYFRLKKKHFPKRVRVNKYALKSRNKKACG